MQIEVADKVRQRSSDVGGRVKQVSRDPEGRGRDSLTQQQAQVRASGFRGAACQQSAGPDERNLRVRVHKILGRHTLARENRLRVVAEVPYQLRETHERAHAHKPRSTTPSTRLVRRAFRPLAHQRISKSLSEIVKE